MNCNETSEVLAAFALGALEEKDASAVRNHLATCRKHDEEFAAFAGLAAGLSSTVAEVEPPAELRQRILQTFDREVTPSEAPGTERKLATPFFRRPAAGWLIAAAMFIAVIGVTTWNVVLQTDGGESRGGWTVSADLTGDGVDGHFWYLGNRELAVVAMDDMPPLQEGHVYQAWVMYDGRTVSLGVMAHEDTVAMKADLEGATMFAITDEPMGGSDAPSGPLVAMAELD